MSKFFLRRRERRPQESFQRSIGVFKEGQHVVIRLHEVEQMRHQMDFIEFTEEDLRWLKVMQPWVEAHLDQVTTAFYDALLQVDQLRAIIHRHSTVERLKGTLRNHLMEMFNGQIDADFIERRLRIARTHIRVGLETKWYMGAYQNLYRSLVGVVARYVSSKEDQIRLSNVIGKLINLEQQLVLEAYEQEYLAQRERLYTEIKEDIKSKIADVSQEATKVARKNEQAVDQLEQSGAQVHRSIEHFLAKIQEARSMTAVGKEKLHQLTETVHRIGLTSKDMEHTLGQFISSYEVIQNIMYAVQDIAKRTNLLALNAIEASRSGTQHGFHVIAKEIRKFSDDTKQSITKMNGLVQRLNEQTREVTSSVEGVRTQLELACEETVETRTALDSIDAMMESNLGDLQRVAHEMDTLIDVIRTMNEAAAQVAASLNLLHQTTQQL